MKPCIAVALSGGLDSLVAAYLLKEQGFTVIGLHFITGFESNFKPEKYPDEKDTEIKPSEILKTDPKNRIYPISKHSAYPIHLVDLQNEFQKCIVNSFVDTYRSGKTPNPCLICNPCIKFGVLMKHAREIGCRKTCHRTLCRNPKGSGRQLSSCKGDG
jgi:tRNA-uridine 2-sulfurtransferase